MDLIQRGQSGIYDKNATLIRYFSGNIRNVIELKNPLSAGTLMREIDKFLQIINPSLQQEIEWFKEAKKLLQLWVNDIVMSNRLLGIKNDNVYNTEAFEKAIMQKFMFYKKPQPNDIIKIEFKEMVELVELGARRFQH